MRVKRIYNHDEDGKPTDVAHIDVQHAGKAWHASTHVVEKGLAEGWLSMGGGKLTIKTADGQPDVVYKIVRGPGQYCCHCHAVIGDEYEGRRHVLTEHAGVKAADVPKDNVALRDGFWKLLGKTKSPDANNPAGYCRIHYYDCVAE